MTIIKNCKIINPEYTIDNANIYLEKNKILKIEPIEGQGSNLIVPGFVDLHIHGIANYDVMDNKESLYKVSKKLAKLGTTSFMPTAMSKQWTKILDSLNSMSLVEKTVSRNLGIHLEGPFINFDKKGAHSAEFLKKATKFKIQKLLFASNNKLKRISFDPTMANLDILKFMKKKEILPSIGHSSASFTLASKYFENGCDSVCHLWNAMSGVDSRNPGIVQAALSNKNVYSEMIIDFIHIKKETVKFTIDIKGVDKVIAISDAIKPAYYKDGESVSGDLVVYKKAKVIKLLATNTIAGSGIVIHDAFKNILKLGYSLNEAVKMTSYNAFRYLGIQNLGKIEENYLADFLILDSKNYSIKKVYINGEVVK
ncbi:N-acetylglucosamine-6-phosphate deacetylase [Mycoplasma sp. AC157]